MIDKYLTDNELVLAEYEDAIEIQRRLINNGYVVMLSREEQFWVLNWIWDSHDAADRNAVIFISREDYEWRSMSRWRRRRKMEPKLTEFEEWCEAVLNNGGITYEPLTDEGARKIEEKWDNDMARLGRTNKYGIRRTSDGRGFEVYRKF